jgi:hypothetical protein
MRIRVPLLLCLLLVACTYVRDESDLEAEIVRPGNFKAGSGVVESVGVLRGARAPGTGADSSGTRPDLNLYRLYLRMDAGGFQTVDVDSAVFLAGQAVELTNDGRVVLVSGTSVNEAIRRAR